MQVLKLYNRDYFISPINTVTIEKRDCQNQFPSHLHEFFEIVIVLAGNGLHTWNDEIHPITSGDILYINNNDIHSYQNVNNLKLDNILYIREKLWSQSILEEYLPAKNSPQSERFWRINPSNLKQIEPIINLINIESKKNHYHSAHLAEALLLQLLIILHRFRQQPTEKSYAKLHQLDMLFTVLHESVSKPFHLEQFCMQHKIASRSLSRLFKQQTNMTISEYLQKLRLCKAMSLLRNSILPIGIISAECGYNDSNYFSLVFKKEMGKNPSDYREQFKKR